MEVISSMHKEGDIEEISPIILALCFNVKKRWAIGKKVERSCSELAEYARYFVNNVLANSVGII